MALALCLVSIDWIDYYHHVSDGEKHSVEFDLIVRLVVGSDNFWSRNLSQPIISKLCLMWLRRDDLPIVHLAHRHRMCRTYSIYVPFAVSSSVCSAKELRTKRRRERERETKEQIMNIAEAFIFNLSLLAWEQLKCICYMRKRTQHERNKCVGERINE